MDRYRLKNIIILILLLVNLFLLGSLAQRRAMEKATYQNTVEQITTLFSMDGVSLDVESIPRDVPPVGWTMSRSTELDRQAAAFLLGEPVSRADQGGGIFTYSGKNGAALFRANGSFSAAGTLSDTNGEDFCRDFCRQFGYDAPQSQLDQNVTGTITAARRWNNLPVLGCTVTFTLTEGRVTGVSGTLLPETATELPDQAEPLSALAALTAFQQNRKETGAVVSSISDIYLCYELQSTTAVPMVLTSAWCIVTNTAKYYVNSATGAVHLF